jgi:peptidoglycan/xylan/chitin deacetylase (PgdA/CDA1 family)
VGNRRADCDEIAISAGRERGIAAHGGNAVRRQLTIIGYHNVEPTPASRFEQGAGVRGLASQLEQLGRVANVVPLGAALNTMSEGGRLPTRAVAITFDDGYRDAVDMALPILERFDLPATFFLAPGLISRECSAWWERLGWAITSASVRQIQWGPRTIRLDTPKERDLARRTLSKELKKLDRCGRESAMQDLVDRLEPCGRSRCEDLFLGWDESREIVRRGFAVGSHSSVHAILARESPAVQYDDLVASKRILEDNLDTQVDLLAYPNGERGDFSVDTIDAATRAGYTHSVTTIHGRNSRATRPHELRRVVVQPNLGVSGLVKVLAQLAAAKIRYPNSGIAASPAALNCVS